MLFCTRCGRAVHENDRFCDRCGAYVDNARRPVESNSSKGWMKVCFAVGIMFALCLGGVFIVNALDGGKMNDSIRVGSDDRDLQASSDSLDTTSMNQRLPIALDALSEKEIVSKVPQYLEWIDGSGDELRTIYSSYHSYTLADLKMVDSDHADARIDLMSTNGSQGYRGEIHVVFEKSADSWLVSDVSIEPGATDPDPELRAFGYRTPEEIESLLRETQGEEGTMSISIASEIDIAPGKKTGVANIENIPSNLYAQRIRLYLDETNELLYESPLLSPGAYIEEVTIDRTLPSGSHEATAEFIAFDGKNLEEMGRTSVAIILNVED